MDEDRNERIVLCEACGSEGRIYHGDGPDPSSWIEECPYCDGTGGEIIQTQPIKMGDLDLMNNGRILAGETWGTGLMTQEDYARLVEEMCDQLPWKDHMWSRGALIMAARTIRRGRHLTAKEQLANLMRALKEPDDD